MNLYTALSAAYIMVEKPCTNCKQVTMIDDEARICYDCFVELDTRSYEEEE